MNAEGVAEGSRGQAAKPRRPWKQFMKRSRAESARSCGASLNLSPFSGLGPPYNNFQGRRAPHLPLPTFCRAVGAPCTNVPEATLWQISTTLLPVIDPIAVFFLPPGAWLARHLRQPDETPFPGFAQPGS